MTREQLQRAVSKKLAPYIDPSVYLPAHGRAVEDIMELIDDYLLGLKAQQALDDADVKGEKPIPWKRPHGKRYKSG